MEAKLVSFTMAQGREKNIAPTTVLSPAQLQSSCLHWCLVLPLPITLIIIFEPPFANPGSMLRPPVITQSDQKQESCDGAACLRPPSFTFL